MTIAVVAQSLVRQKNWRTETSNFLRYAVDRLNDLLLQFLHLVRWGLIQTLLHVLEEPRVRRRGLTLT